MRKIRKGVDRALEIGYYDVMENEATTTRTEDERIVNILRSMLATWDTLSDAAKKDALTKATFIAGRK